MNIKNIKILFIDCDGVLTDGNFHVSSNGIVTKSFNTKDFYAINKLKSLGINVIIITGSNDGAVDMKAMQSSVTCLSNVKDKVKEIEFIIDGLFKWGEVAFIGDSENDIEAIKNSAFSACPNDAIAEVKNIVDYISSKNGGHQAVRDIIKWMVEEMGHEWVNENVND